MVLETPDCSGVKGIGTYEDYSKIHPLDHINGFTPKTLRGFAERLGFESIAKPVSHVTCDPFRVAKTEMKRVIGGVLSPTTDQYFRKK